MQIWRSPWVQYWNATGLQGSRTLKSTTFNTRVFARASPILRVFDLVRSMANQGKEVPFVIPANANRWWNDDTVAIVTGANKGIGFDIARILAENGLKTVVTSRNGKLRGTWFPQHLFVVTIR